MKDGLYHIEVCWKKGIQQQIDAALNSGLPFKFDQHADEKKFERGVSTDVITIEKLKNGYCFEAEVKNDKVVKFVIRFGYNDTYDLVTVWYPRKKCLYCMTVWFNEKDDKHYTLDESKYVAYYEEEGEKHVGFNLGDLIRQQQKKK